MTSKFRKKPVVIEAERAGALILNARDNWRALPKWFIDAYDKGDVAIFPRGITLRTLEGTMTASFDDMVICGVQGELYPCKPDIFAATYEPAE